MKVTEVMTRYDPKEKRSKIIFVRSNRLIARPRAYYPTNASLDRYINLVSKSSMILFWSNFNMCYVTTNVIKVGV